MDAVVILATNTEVVVETMEVELEEDITIEAVDEDADEEDTAAEDVVGVGAEAETTTITTGVVAAAITTIPTKIPMPG